MTDVSSPQRRRPWRVVLSVLAFLLFLCGLSAMVALSGYGGLQAGRGIRSARSTATANAYVVERFQRGLDELNRGNYLLAEANLEEVLRYQPGNVGVQNLIVTAQIAQTPTFVPPTPTPTRVTTDKGALLREMQAAMARQNWDAAINLADQLRALDSAYETDTVEQLRYQALVARGLSRLDEGAIEAGLYDLDIASTIHQLDAATESKRRMAALYQNAINYLGADWEKAIKLLGELYAISPGYRDVATQLFEAYQGAGDAYAGNQNWCPAEQRYAEALAVARNTRVEAKRADAQQRCLTATTVPLTASLETGALAPGAAGLPGRLAFAAYDATKGYYQLYVFDGATSQLSGIAAGGMQPAFRRGDGVLAYTVGSAINAYYPDGGMGMLLPVDAAWPSLSPDGLRVAYAVSADGVWHINAAPLDGSSAPVEIAQGTYPAWGPSGLIAYQGCPDGNCGLYAINPDQPADRRRLSTSPGDINPSWSPTGGELAYATNFSGAWEIYAVAVSGGQFRQLTTFGAQSTAPTWSPDGSRIAFESNREGSWGIYVMNSDGSNPHKVIDIGAQHPSWQTERLTWAP